MSHAKTADKLLIKPAAGARPAPPHTRGQFIPKARTRRPVTRRVTHGTATTRLATAPDRPTRRVLPSPERSGSTIYLLWRMRASRRRGAAAGHGGGGRDRRRLNGQRPVGARSARSPPAPAR